MRNNDAITFEIGRRDLEVILGNLSLMIAKMERTQEALKDAADLIRTALQEDDSDEPDCENCDLPCRHNPNITETPEDSLDDEDYELLKQLQVLVEAKKQEGANPEQAEKELQEDAGITEPAREEKFDAAEDPDDEDEAESLAIELLKAVFSVLAETIENGD